MMLPASRLLRALIYLPAKFYELLVRLRIVLYEYRYLRAKRLDAVVISIGNITLGGTGKTPLVEYIARFLAEENIDVAILSRGYKRTDRRRAQLLVCNGKEILATVEEAGDEPFMLARKLSDVKIIVGANRYRSGAYAERELGTEVCLLDDGFQHLALQRDLDIVVLDGTDPFGSGEMVPFGKLREPIYGLRRAHAIVVTRADRPIEQDLIFKILDGLGLNVPVIYSYYDIVGLTDITSGKPIALRRLHGARAGVICAIGNPQLFLADLAAHQVEIVSEHLFPDHHNYTQADLDEAIKQAQSAGAEYLITTEKDSVKLARLASGPLPIYAIEIKVAFEDEVKLRSILLRAIKNRRSR